MKQSIKWHRQCLENQEKRLQEEEVCLARLEKRVERSRQESALYKAQVELAEKEGKDGFDSERYAIKRLCT